MLVSAPLIKDLRGMKKIALSVINYAMELVTMGKNALSTVFAAFYHKYISANKYKIPFIALLSLPMLQAKAQNYEPGKLPSFALGAGVLWFNGDIGKGAGVSPYSTIRPGASFTIEERPFSFLGFSLSGLYGSLAASERSLDSANNLNFQSKIISGDLLVNFHLDGAILKNDAPIAPFVYAGVSFLYYNPYSDLKDAQGQPYFYWTDGTIRNEPQNSGDILTAKIINRDYTYETPLDSGKYSKTTLCIPVGIGLKFRITSSFCMNIQTTYYFTFSPNIDNYKLSGKNNKFMYSFFSLEYRIGGDRDKREKRYEGVDFSAFVIKDTARPVPVVEVKEKPMSDSAIAAQHGRDTMAMDRSQVFNENPKIDALTNVDKSVKGGPHKLPPRFQPADKNGDGVISSQEISSAIDDFFDGTSTMTIADINAMIDYFFDQ